MRARGRESYSRAGTPTRTMPLARVCSFTEPIEEQQRARAAALRSRRSRRLRLGPLAHALEYAAPAHVPRPAPNLPRRRPLLDGEEDDLGPADQVLERHVPDAALVPRQPRIAG